MLYLSFQIRYIFLSTKNEGYTDLKKIYKFSKYMLKIKLSLCPYILFGTHKVAVSDRGRGAISREGQREGHASVSTTLPDSGSGGNMAQDSFC